MIDVHAEPSADAVALQAAGIVAAAARRAVDARGQFSIALSGGSTPWKMLHRLASEDLPWANVHVFQVDERVAPDGDPARNLTHIKAHLLDRVDIPAGNVHAMPVTGDSSVHGAQAYGRELMEVAGDPPVLDLVHLGLGSDGHTASLLPGDDVLQVHDQDVAMTGTYQGHQRMTLTFPMINRARLILWLVMGEDKAAMVTRMQQADLSVPAGNISQEQAVLVTDIHTVVGDKSISSEGQNTC